MHFIPIKFDTSKQIEKFKILKISKLSDIRKLGKGKNYLYIHNSKGGIYFLGTMDTMKKEVAKQFGDLDAWFYPLEEHEENIKKKSIDIWRDNFIC